MSTAIVWFRRDLRLADHPALTEALRAHDAVLPVYVHAAAPWYQALAQAERLAGERVIPAALRHPPGT